MHHKQPQQPTKKEGQPFGAGAPQQGQLPQQRTQMRFPEDKFRELVRERRRGEEEERSAL